MERRNLSPLIAALLLAGLVVSGCGTNIELRRLGTRAVVIAIDGADWKLIEALAAEGGMPHLMALREQGVWGPIETLHDMPLSPVIWTSVATGKTAAEHGISWFMVDRPDGTRVPVRSHNRKVKAIWNMLGENGRRPTVIGWWATYPAEDVGKGIIVSDALGFHGFGSTARRGDDRRKTYPRSLLSEVNALVPASQQISADFARRFIHLSAEEYRRQMYTPARFREHDPFNPIHLFQQYAVTAQGYANIAEELLTGRPYDLFMVYFEQVDSFSHLFMKYAPPKLEWVGEAEFERYRDLVAEWYRYQDELLGRLLAKIDLDTTAVFLLSDHGFKSGERRIRSEETVDVKRAHLDHETQGVFVAAGPHLRRGAEIAGASVLDVTPTLLHYLGFPVAKDMDGRVLEAVFQPQFMRRVPIRYIATYEDEDEEKAPVDDAEEVRPEEVARAEEALRALGYLGGSSRAEKEGDEGTAQEEESSPEIHNNLGRIHLQAGDVDKARQEFEAALKLDPRNADALLNLGSLHRLEGRLAQAEHLVKRALQVDPNSIAALTQLAEIQRDLGNLEEAIRLFRVALEIDAAQPFVLLGLGDVLQRAGRFEAAEGAFKGVLELDPDSFKAYYNLGVTYGNQGRQDEAIAQYEKALELAPEHPEASKALNNLGAIYLERNEIDKARERFAKAVKASPVNLESRYNLALIYLQDERIDEAITLLEEAATLAPNHEAVNLQLGMAYLQVGRNQDAYRSLLLVRRLYPENWAAPLGLAVLHARHQQTEQARQLLAEALRVGGEAAKARAAGFPVLGDLLSD